MKELKNHRKKNAPYPQLPMFDVNCNVVGLEPMQKEDKDAFFQELHEDAQPILISPGDVIVFSGAHLHGSVVNKTGKTRFSTELRTVDALDVTEERHARNIDGHSPGVQYKWFESIGELGEDEGIDKGVRLDRLVEKIKTT